VSDTISFLGESTTMVEASVIIGSSSSQIQRYFNNVSATDLLTEILFYNKIMINIWFKLLQNLPFSGLVISFGIHMQPTNLGLTRSVFFLISASNSSPRSLSFSFRTSSDFETIIIIVINK